ncbi:MAG: hypothetical protein DMF26_04900 [Verrucomicrobia bacterium]|nr:MAG: hypothetical protein DMF26_04900 [Verrucomicrobiota bacterium]
MASTRLFRFYVTFDATAVPESIQDDDRFSFDITGYCLNYDIGELAGPVHMSEDLGGWHRRKVPLLDRSDRTSKFQT